MKKIFLLIFAVAVMASCNKDDDADSNTLGGETDVPMNQEGNEFTSTVNFDGNYANIYGVVTQSDNGIITINISGTVPEDFPLADLLPDEYIDASGNFDTELEFKNTSEGILDYINADAKPFVLVKYDAKVGDKWVCKKSDGSKITREVTCKSTDDDYPYGFYMIKTITVEQDSRIPGVDKIIYNANHRFGLVGVEVVLEDGSSIQSILYSTYELKD